MSTEQKEKCRKRETMIFDYFYKEQSENYTFYKIPKVLFTEGPFQKMSTDAKVLYGLLLERTSLSRENGWFDENGRIFVYYTIKAVKASMGCANDKAVGLLKELERMGLIEKRKQGLCKPTIIYVKDFMGFRKTERRNSDNQNSGVPKIRILDDRKAESNNTENNNTDFNKTNLILSGLDVDKDERSVYHDILMEQLSLDILYERYPFDRDTLDAILDMMLDIICSKKKDILIAGDRRPLNVVKSQFLKLNSMHIEYVMDCLKSNPVKVRNIKQYLLAALYNAPLTINSYYQAMVNNDMAEGRI